MEYKRFTKFIKGVPAIRTYTGSYMTPFDSDVYDAIKCLAELEDKIEQGTLKEIPENAVVLTREAYNRLFTKARQSEIKTIDLESIVNARKETAEKFAEKIHNLFNRDIKDSVVYTQEEKDILKEFVESIYEICKELTDGEKEISNETV